MNGISTKVGAGAAAGALATVVWTILAATVPAIAGWSAETLATVTTGSATVLSFFAGYLVRETVGGIDSTLQDLLTPVDGAPSDNEGGV